MKKLPVPVILLSVLFLFGACSTVTHIASIDVQSTTIEERSYDTTISEMIRPYKEELDAEMNVVIGTLPESMFKGRPESELGNWFADALHRIAEAEFGVPVSFAMQNYGGLRIPGLNEGPLLKGNIFELMPFDNNLVLLTVDADETMQFIQSMAAGNGDPQSFSLRYKIKDGKATDITIHGEPIKQGVSYNIALPDYVANGGGGNFFLTDNPRMDNGLLIRTAIIDYIEKNAQEGIVVEAEKDNRITIE